MSGDIALVPKRPVPPMSADARHKGDDVRGAIDACVGALAKLLPQEKAEMATFYEEPKLPTEVQAALLAAAEALKTAREAVALLKQGKGLAALEEARSVLEPPPELEAAVEAVCTLLEERPYFYDAQSRLLRNPTAFVDKLLEYNAVRLPPLARSKLTSFLATPLVPTTAPANGVNFVQENNAR
jgi:hypothetical protein